MAHTRTHTLESSIARHIHRVTEPVGEEAPSFEHALFVMAQVMSRRDTGSAPRAGSDSTEDRYTCTYIVRTCRYM